MSYINSTFGSKQSSEQHCGPVKDTERFRFGCKTLNFPMLGRQPCLQQEHSRKGLQEYLVNPQLQEKEKRHSLSNRIQKAFVDAEQI